MAELAVHAIQSLAARDHRRIAWWMLRKGIRESASTAASSPSACRWLRGWLRRCLGDCRDGQRGQNRGDKKLLQD